MSGDILLLQSGCLCCTMRSDLVDTLETALARVARGDRAVRRVIVETTGLADPQPILQAFLADPLLARRFASAASRPQSMLSSAKPHSIPRGGRQANRGCRPAALTKLIWPWEDINNLQRRLRHLNTAAPITRCSLDTALDPTELWRDKSDVSHSLHHEPNQDRCAVHDHTGCTAPCANESTTNLHSDLVRTVSFVCDALIAPETLDRALTSSLDFAAPDLLRFKVIVNLAGLPGPLVLHGEQYVIHPPPRLPAWPSVTAARAWSLSPLGSRRARRSLARVLQSVDQNS